MQHHVCDGIQSFINLSIGGREINKERVSAMVYNQVYSKYAMFKQSSHHANASFFDQHRGSNLTSLFRHLIVFLITWVPAKVLLWVIISPTYVSHKLLPAVPIFSMYIMAFKVL